jgi:holliday junction DNA helicase RuvA
MIHSIQGKLLQYSPTFLVIQNGGLGIGAHVPVTTSQIFNTLGQEVFLHTHLHVQMNARSGDTSLALFGFNRPIEKDVFLLLISISGIGPKGALRILSETTPEDLAAIVMADNMNGLTRLKGIGKKTAEILMPQLKNAFEKIDLSQISDQSLSMQSGNASEAVWALISLGVKDTVAKKAVEKAVLLAGRSSGYHCADSRSSQKHLKMKTASQD